VVIDITPTGGYDADHLRSYYSKNVNTLRDGIFNNFRVMKVDASEIVDQLNEDKAYRIVYDEMNGLKYVKRNVEVAFYKNKSDAYDALKELDIKEKLFNLSYIVKVYRVEEIYLRSFDNEKLQRKLNCVFWAFLNHKKQWSYKIRFQLLETWPPNFETGYWHIIKPTEKLSKEYKAFYCGTVTIKLKEDYVTIYNRVKRILKELEIPKDL